MKNRVLLVDDKPSNLMVFEGILSNLDVVCVKAKSGKEAFAKLTENDISLILLDVQMPGMDGFEILKTIRKNKNWKDIPVIFISAVYRSGIHQIRGIDLGAIDFIVKPVVPEILSGKIKTFLELYEHRRKQNIKIAEISSELAITEIIKNENLLLNSANEIFQNIINLETQEKAATYILNVLERITGSKFGFIGEINKNNKLDTFAISNPGWDACKMPGTKAVKSLQNSELRGIWSATVKENRSIVENSPTQNPHSIGIPEGHPELTSFMGVPLRYGDKLYGIIALANKPGGYTSKDVENIEILSSIVTEALTRKKVELELVGYKQDLEKMVVGRTLQLESKNKQLRLEKKERKAAINIINASPAVAFRWKNIKGLPLEYVSENIKELSGYSVNELLSGKINILGLVHPGDLERVNNELTDFSKERNESTFTHAPFRILKKNGDVIWVDERIILLRDKKGHITHFQGIIIDITEKVRTSEELIAAKERAEESDRLKTAFLANMSHEIRTPMNAILGFSQLLAVPGLEDGEIKNYVDTIAHSGKQLLSLIDDIISISQIEAGIVEVHFDNTSVERILNTVHKLFSLSADKSGIAFSYQNDLPKKHQTVSTDARRIQQVLINLLGNAFKFTSAGNIEFGCKLKNNNIEFYVSDTGIGIQKADRTIIFERFMQVNHDHDVLYGGTGIGLSISKAIVEKLGGKIWVAAKKGKGSEFRFTIPVIEQTAQPDIVDEKEKNLT